MGTKLHTLTITLVFLLIAASSCNSDAGRVNTEHPGPYGGLPDLPLLEREVSALRTVHGANAFLFGPGTEIEGSALRIDATDPDISWALYAFNAPDPPGLNSLLLDVTEVTGEFWVGLSDYGITKNWHWHGPFTDDTQIDFGADSDRYISPAGNLYWLVVTEGDSTILMRESVVDFEYESLEFRVPPPGIQTIAPAPALNPSLVLMPETDGLADEGAPVVFYTTVTEELSQIYFTFYNGVNWEQRMFNPGGHSLATPAALWLGDSGALVAYDFEEGPGEPFGIGQLVLYHCNEDWSVNTIEPLSAPFGLALTNLEAAYNPDSEDFAIIHTYTNTPQDTVQMHVGHLPTGWHSTMPLVLDGHTVVGADIEFNPVDGMPMAVFSQGTIDDSETIILDFLISYGSFTGTTWNMSGTDYNAPLTLDLAFAPDDSPRLVMISARDFSYVFPPPPLPPLIDLTATLYFDIALGTFDGDWAFETLYESQVDISEIFSNRIGLDLGVDAAWASTDSLAYSHADGVIEFEMNPEFAITGGNMTNQVTFEQGDGGGGFDPVPYFTGSPGIDFSWQDGPDGPVCAYIRGDGLDVTGLLGGGVDTSNELYYWSPPAP